MSEILINDLVEELSEENLRLLNGISFERQLTHILDNLKTFVNDFKHLSLEQIQRLEEFGTNVNDIISETKLKASLNANTDDECIVSQNTAPEDHGLQVIAGTDDRDNHSMSEAIGLQTLSTTIELATDDSHHKTSHPTQPQHPYKSIKRIKIIPKTPLNSIVVLNTGKQVIATSDDSPSGGQQLAVAGVSVRSKCPFTGCNLFFDDLRQFTAHMADSHIRAGLPSVATGIKCSFTDCHQRFRRLDEYHRHLDATHRIHGCCVCGKRFTTSEMLNAHRKACKDHRKSGPQRVGHRLQSANNTLVKESTDDYTKEVRRKCCIECLVKRCKHQFADKTAFFEHLTADHQIESIYECEYQCCDKVFATVEDRDSHVSDVHVQRYGCRPTLCAKQYVSGHKLRTQLLYETQETVMRCRRCPYEGKARQDLIYHTNQHKNIRPYVCQREGCGRGFYSPHSLRHHTDKHREAAAGGHPAFACDYPQCGQRFDLQMNLKTHRAKHPDSKQRQLFPCPEPGCGRAYTRLHSLSVHLCGGHRYSPSGSDTACGWPDCEFKARTAGAMAKHRASHGAGKRPFACDWPGCAYRSQFKRNLGNHRRAHNQDRPHPCQWPDCGRAFKDKHSLTKHAVKHSGG